MRTSIRVAFVPRSNIYAPTELFVVFSSKASLNGVVCELRARQRYLAVHSRCIVYYSMSVDADFRVLHVSLRPRRSSSFTLKPRL